MPVQSPHISSFFATFETIRIVNLPHRTDRRRQMEHELVRAGLGGDERVAFFPAIMTAERAPFLRAGSRGAFLSHLKLLEQAAEGGKSILILQDDCKFLLDQIESYRLPRKWDIFYGGYVASDPDNLAESDIIGAHFMAFSSRAAKVAVDYLTQYLDPHFPADLHAAADSRYDHGIRPPIDGALVWLRRAHPGLVTVFKMLGIQRPSRTDIGNRKFYDHIPVLRRVVETLRRWRPAFRSTGMREAIFRAPD